jgi:hypothetical protein
VPLVAVIFVKSHLPGECLFMCAENNFLYFYRMQHASSTSVTDEILRVIAVRVCRTDSNISATCFKRSGRRVFWLPIILAGKRCSHLAATFGYAALLVSKCLLLESFRFPAGYPTSANSLPGAPSGCESRTCLNIAFLYHLGGIKTVGTSTVRLSGSKALCLWFWDVF